MSGAANGCGPILVVDDDRGARELVTGVLAEAGYAADGYPTAHAGLSEAERRRPRLAILDVCMPGVSGYELCRRLRDLYGDSVPILFVSGERTEAVDRTAGLLLGGDDYLVKPFSPDELVARVVSLLRRAPEENGGPSLTRREQAVLSLLAEGMSRNDIADRLVISPKTVSTHLGRIYEKLGVRDRVHALIVAHRRGLIDGI